MLEEEPGVNNAGGRMLARKAEGLVLHLVGSYSEGFGEFLSCLAFFFFQESPFLRLDEPPWFFSVNSGLFTKQQNIGTERRPPVLPTLPSAEQRHFRTYATPSDSPETMGKQFAVYTAVYPSRLACRTLLCTAPTLRFYVTKTAQFHQ